MESEYDFLDIFIKIWKMKESTELRRLFSDGWKYLRDLSHEGKGIFLEKLFDDRHGLHRFICTTLDRPYVPKEDDLTAREAIHLLEDLIKNYSEYLKPFLTTIFEVCSSIVALKTRKLTIRAAYLALMAFIDMFPEYNTGYGDFIEEFMTKQTFYEQKEKSYMIHISTLIARYHPNIDSIIAHGYEIQRLAVEELVDVYSKAVNNHQLQRLNIYIDSLTNILCCFPIENTIRQQEIYRRIQGILGEVDHDFEKHISTIKCVIKFMSQHISKVSNVMHQHTNEWILFYSKAAVNETLSPIALGALRVHYEFLGNFLKEINCDKVRLLLVLIVQNFKRNLLNEYSNPKMMRSDIIGCSRMAECTKKFLGEATLENLYSLISRRIFPLYFHDDNIETNLDDLIDYQEALAQMLAQLSNVNIHRLGMPIKICTIVIKRFPELSPSSQQHAVESLQRTIRHMQQLKGYIFKEFFSSVIYEGVIWSCSHALVIDAQLMKDQENLRKPPICCKDYLPLWQSLLKNEHHELDRQDGIATELLNVCRILVSKLNLQIKSREENVFSDIAISYMPENDTDLRIFLNIVDLYSNLLSNIAEECSSEDLNAILHCMIELSNRNPLISGFYRLISNILNVTDVFKTTDGVDLVQEYLRKVLKQIFEFSHELQISCIYLILHVPKNFVNELVPHVAPVFQIAFKLGLNNYELANETLDDLQRYFYWSDEDLIKPLLLEVLPSLELYVQSKECLEIYDDPENPEKQVKKTGSNLEELQNRILLFIGQIDNATMLQFLHKQSQNTGASWDMKNLLEYTMTFPDGNLMVHLDTILPRIIELSLNCTDRRTRISACEALHSIVVIVLGNTIFYISADPERYARLYKTLCPVLLKLGCDHDDVIKQIFSPLMLQMTHWVSSGLMLKSKVVDFLINDLFDGLRDAHNASIKDFAGICLKEFVIWSIKQASDIDLRTAPDNINTVVQNIKSFALHPLKNQKIAAAIAFNHIYKNLREREEIINIFWLEFLHCFVESMDGCSDPRIRDALDHVARVLLERSTVFERNTSSRKIPRGFTDGTLNSCVEYLFVSCMSFDKNARHKSMELTERLLAKLSERSTIPIPINRIQQAGCLKLQCSTLERVRRSQSRQEIVKNMTVAVDVHTWFLRKKLIDSRILFSDFLKGGKPSIFSDLRGLLNAIDEYPIGDAELSLNIIDFAIEVLQAQILIADKQKIRTSMFDKRFFVLVSNMIFNPMWLGFDTRYPDIAKMVPAKTKTLIELLIDYLSSRQIEQLCEIVEHKMYAAWQIFHEITRKLKVLDHNKELIKKLIFIKDCNLLKRLRLNSVIFSKKLNIITYIFQEMENYERNSNKYGDLLQESISYFGNLLEVVWDTEAWLILLTEKSQEFSEILWSDDCSEISCSEYFFITFRDVLIRSFANDIDSTLQIFSNVLDNTVDYSLFILNEIAIWLQKHKKDYQEFCEKFANGIIDMFASLRNSINNIEKRKLMVRNIYKISIRLKANVINLKATNQDLYKWVLEEICNSPTITEQTQVLSDFIISLVDEFDNDIEIQLILMKLTNISELRGSDGSIKKTMESLEVVGLYQTLCTALATAKSFTILEAVVNFGKTIGKFATGVRTNDNLATFLNSLSEERATEALEKIYQIFMFAPDSHGRLDVLKNFLCPAFKSCSEPTVSLFFEKNITEIMTTITRNCPQGPQDKLKLEISKIGAYNLLEIMFSTLDLEKINNPTKLIAMEITKVTKVNAEILLQVYKNTIEARKLKVDHDNREISRLLHCAAYNCAITIITVCKDEKYLKGLFGEDPAKDQLIWKKIIDCSKKYELSQTFKDLPKQRKVLVNIRQTWQSGQQTSPSYSYLRSYNLASSTLTEDISPYDMNGVVPLQEPASSKLSVTLEADDLNDHECMAQICGVIKFIFEVHVQNSEELPAVFNPFIGALVLINNYNVQLFLMKIIINCQEQFRPFAKFFLKRIIRLLSSFIERTTINYIIADAILMLIDWAEVAIPDDEIHESANNMFSLLVKKVNLNSSSKAIARYNYNIIEMLVTVWHSVLQIPSCLDEKMKDDPNAAVILIHIFLARGLGELLINDSNVIHFLIEYVKHWTIGEEFIMKAFSAIGLFLKFMTSHDPDDQRKKYSLSQIRKFLSKIGEPDRRIKCIYAMCTAFPELLDHFYEVASILYKSATTATGVKVLELFLLRIPSFSNDEIQSQIKHFNLENLLENKVLAYEKICLQIIQKLVNKLKPELLLPLAQLAVNYSQDVNQQYRELVYDIFIAIFNKYLKAEFMEEKVEDLIALGQGILLRGLLDTSQRLQEKMMNFWKETNKFGATCHQQILNILADYSPKISQDFLQILAILFLNFSEKSPNYEAKLFPALDKECNYKNYKIATELRMRNLTYRVPLFVSSYARQCSQRFTLSSLASDDYASSHDNLMLRATNPMEFAPTFVETSMPKLTITAFDDDAVFAVPTIPKTNLSRRFVNKPRSNNFYGSRNELQMQTRRDNYMQERSLEQRNTVKLNRSYRIGDLPDIAITHQAVLNPIQNLLKKDQVICKNFVVSVISSLIKKLQNDRTNHNKQLTFNRKLSERFETIFENCHGPAPTIAAALEIIWSNPELTYKSDTIARLCHSTGPNALVALLIERSVMHSEDAEVPSKIIRLEDDNNDMVYQWVYLGELYESINDTDVFLSVFSNHLPIKTLNDAALARSKNDWEKAKLSYKTTQARMTGAIFQHCQRGLFECLAHLSGWDEIVKEMENYYGADQTVSDVLKMVKSHEHGWVVPWYFRSHIHRHFTTFSNEPEHVFLKKLQLALDNPCEKTIVAALYTEELSAICPFTLKEHSKFLVVSALKKMKDQWSQLSSLSVQLRFQKVIQLRGLCDITIFRNAATNTKKDLNQLLQCWERSLPSVNDDLVSWDIHIGRRINFSSMLETKLQLKESEISNLQETMDKQQFAFINAAYHQKNPASMKAQMFCVSNQQTSEFQLNLARFKFLRGQLNEGSEQIRLFKESREKSLRLANNCHIPWNVEMGNMHLVVDWSCAMLALQERNSSDFNDAIDDLIESSLFKNVDDAEGRIEELEKCAIRSIEKSIKTAPPKFICECHLKMIKFCHNRIIEGKENIENIQMFVKSTLEAMNIGSNEASSYFPCVLREDYFNNQVIADTFTNLTSSIPSSRFLKWQPQLFRHLATSLHDMVSPIIDRLAHDYPNALLYTLQTLMSTMPHLEDDETISDLIDKFSDRTDFQDFVEAIEYLVRPELYLIYQLQMLIKNIKVLKLETNLAVNHLMKKVYDLQNPSMQGDLYKSCIGEFKNDVLKIKDIESEEVFHHVEQLKRRLNESIKMKKDSNKLEDYSPYLSQINGSEIQIPSFYIDDSSSKYTPKIMKIEPVVQVMQSNRKPIKITIIGDDTKSYDFLVKFGEDLRLDQRLQQTFNLVNVILEADPSCSEKNLSISTYRVIPFSGSLGLIEWIDNTKTFQDFIEFSMNDAQKKNLQRAEMEYENWIVESSEGGLMRSIKYKKSVLKYTAQETINKMNSLIAKTDTGALRRSCITINPTAESFMSFRRNFITSYAVMCTVQWILGIGDRHLENTMIQIESGKCIGIDFASAFGTGLDQPIPELMPFRLTSQILKLMQPFDEKDLFGITMIHVLKALRRNRGLIAELLEVIVHDNLDWIQYANKFAQDPKGDPDVTWVPKKKIKTMMKKLNGDNPTDIMIEELKNQHADSTYYPRYVAIVGGNDINHERVRFKFKGKTMLTPEEQVECLLDQATDLNILGRTYVGWRPWL